MTKSTFSNCYSFISYFSLDNEEVGAKSGSQL